MKKKIIIILLFIGVIFISGCAKQTGIETISGEKEMLRHPRASEAEVLKNLTKSLRKKFDLSEDVKVKVYNAEGSSFDIAGWVRSKLLNKGWTVMGSKYDTIIWKKGERGIGTAFVAGPESGEFISEIGETTYIVIKDDKEGWDSTWKRLIKSDISLPGALISFKTLSLEKCRELENQTKRDSCYYYLGNLAFNVSFCDKREKPYPCYLSIARRSKDTSVCKKISDKEYKDACYSHIARVTGNSTYCKKVQDQEKLDDCYFQVGKDTANLSLCKKIQDQKEEDWCRYHVAQAKKDSSICDKIEIEKIKNSCYSNLE